VTTLAPAALDFPILQQEFDEGRLVYLDSAATSQKPAAVLDAMDAAYRTRHASIHRGVYPLAARSTEDFEAARDTVARWIGAASSREVVFTGNASAALNIAARGLAGPGDTVLLTEMEHHSNIVPWQLAGARIEPVRVTGDGTLDLDDGAQAAPHMALDMADTGADLYAFTAHKMYGPTGIGVLWGRREILERIEPLHGGGHMISRVDWEGSRWNELPWKFEAGTSPIVEAIGLAAAIDWLGGIGMDSLREHEADLTAYALDRLAEVPGLTVHGPPAEARGSLASFAIEGAHPHDIAEILGRRNVCVRAGHHCAQPLMRRLGVPATARASFAVHNTRADVDSLIDGLHEVRSVLEL